MPVKRDYKKENHVSENSAKKISGTALGIAIGIGAGMAIGVALNNIALGIAIGVPIGTTLGISLDSQKKEKNNHRNSNTGRINRSNTKASGTIRFLGIFAILLGIIVLSLLYFFIKKS